MSSYQISPVTGAEVSGVTTVCVTVVGTVLAASAIVFAGVAYAAYKTVNHALSDQADEKGLQAIADLKANMPKLKQKATLLVAQHKLSPLDAAKVTAMVTISSMNYAVNNQELVKTNWKNLQQATTLNQVNTAQAYLQNVLEQQNQQVLVERLVVCTQNASIRAGFEQIKVNSSQGKTRIIASNFKGEALVTEISGNDNITIATETIGITGGSCKSILEIFNQALAAEGVKKGDPDEKWTGGVCELAASREFIRSRPTRKTTPKTSQNLPETPNRPILPKPVIQQKAQNHQ